MDWHASGRGMAALIVTAALLLSGSLARAEIVQKGELRVDVIGSFAPRKLPRSRPAPISVNGGGRILTTDGTMPPQLEQLRIEINREGRLDGQGLPVCPVHAIHPASTSRALAACRSSLVGEGTFAAKVTLSGQDPYPTQGRLLVFNGRRGGRPVLLGQIYAERPFANSFVIVFAQKRISRGPYGTELVAALPKALGSWGSLTELTMTLSRRYAYRGTRRSFVSAGCPAPKGFAGAPFPLARTSFVFADGKRLSSVLVRDCKVRG